MSGDDGTWWCSTREEGNYTGPFDTREEAIAELCGAPGFVGFKGPLAWPKLPDGTPKLLDAASVLERLVEDVCGELHSEHPEYEDWLLGVTRPMEDELSVELNAALKAWMDKHGYGLPRVIRGVEHVQDGVVTE